jgi:hypothetical protein
MGLSKYFESNVDVDARTQLAQNTTNLGQLGKLVSDTTYNSAWITGTPTADAGTDYITLTGHGLVNGDAVEFDTNAGALPGGISAYNADTIGGFYYNVINVSGDTFQITATPGDSTPVDITSAGTSGWRIRKADVTMVWPTLDLDVEFEYDIYTMGQYVIKTAGGNTFYVETAGLTGSKFHSNLAWDTAYGSLATAINKKYSFITTHIDVKKLATGLIRVKLFHSGPMSNDKSAQTYVNDECTAFITYTSGNLTGLKRWSNDPASMNFRNGTRVLVYRMVWQ